MLFSARDHLNISSYATGERHWHAASLYTKQLALWLTGAWAYWHTRFTIKQTAHGQVSISAAKRQCL